MTNVEKWPEAFQNGIPKVGGRWRWAGYLGHATVGRTEGSKVVYEKPLGFDWADVFRDETRGFTFLGFSDPPLAGVGAAAPQAASVVPRGWGAVKVDHSSWHCTGLGTGAAYYERVHVCGARAAWCCQETMEAACAAHLHRFDASGKYIGGAAPAPVPAPPPSRPADAPLAILPQTGVRHEVFEQHAQGYETLGEFASAKMAHKQARKALAGDLAYDAEASAIREGRVVRKQALALMGAGDRECFRLRGLREFAVMASAGHALHLWWAR